MKVAVIGVGRMGGAMAARIAAAGHEVVVWNRSDERAAKVASETGAVVAGSPREAADGADVCLVSLADDAAVREVYRDEANGLVAGLGSESVVCDTSTVAPQTARDAGALVAGAGATFLDTPVSGSVPMVEAGALTVLAGGDAAGLERARPVLETFAAKVFHLGEVGAGATMKLVVNSVVAVFNAALGEALVLAEKSGLDLERAYDVLQASAAGAPYVTYKRSAFLDPENSPVAFTLALVAKDQGLIDQLANEVDATMALGDAARQLVAEAVEAGLGERDMAAIAEHIRRS